MLRQSAIDKIDASGDCWLWTGAVDKDGYGRLGNKAAYRVVYEGLVGPITEEHIDHLCRTRLCVNPDHLEPVSERVNILRGFSPAALGARRQNCLRGHPLIRRGRQRICPLCTAARAARYRDRKRAAA